jgi:hypothetical protein
LSSLHGGVAELLDSLLRAAGGAEEQVIRHAFVFPLRLQLGELLALAGQILLAWPRVGVWAYEDPLLELGQDGLADVLVDEVTASGHPAAAASRFGWAERGARPRPRPCSRRQV